MVRMPLVGARSLIEVGTPWSGPRASPSMTACSALRAASMANSGVGVQIALSLGLSASRRARVVSITSTGDSALVAISSTSSLAGV